MSWHHNHQQPHEEDGTLRRPFLPVRFQLTGTRNSVAAYLNMLETIVTLADVSDPMPVRLGLIEVTGVIFRCHPLKGEPR